MPNIGHDQADSREYTGRFRYKNGPDAGRLGQRGGVERPGTAEGDQSETAWIAAAFARCLPGPRILPIVWKQTLKGNASSLCHSK